MSRDGHRDRWRSEVMKTALISDSVRVVLLALADYMTARGYVSVPRSKLCKIVGRSPRRVTERLEKARAAGFLDVVRQGRPGQTAEYVATFPDGADGRTKLDHLMVRSAAPTDGADGRTTLHSATWCGRGARQYARVNNASRKQNDVADDVGVDRTSDAKNGSDGRRDLGVIPLAALSPWARLAYAPIKVIAS